MKMSSIKDQIQLFQNNLNENKRQKEWEILNWYMAYETWEKKRFLAVLLPSYHETTYKKEFGLSPKRCLAFSGSWEITPTP